MTENIKNNPQACLTDEIPEGIGEFGLEVTNPIPIHGINSNKEYLSRLRTQNGEKVRFQRLGSTKAKNIQMPIDKYSIRDSNKEEIAILFLSPYHWKTSMKSPKGFQLINK